MKKLTIAASAALVSLLSHSPALAASDKDIAELKAMIKDMKQNYENRIAELESKLSKVEQNKAASVGSGNTNANPNNIDPNATQRNVPATARRAIMDNRFNPSIGVLFNGQLAGFSSEESEISGFAVGEEGERGKQGFAVDHTEFNFSANVDDKFFGATTAAIEDHEGKTELVLEEAFIQTLPGLGLPDGMSIKAGRAFWTFGYLNEHHSHTDDFADRPLPYRVFLDHAYNDDGAEFSYVLPTDFYAEVGGGLFRRDAFPFGGSDGESIDAWSAFARVGGDIGSNQNWRLGAYMLRGEASSARESNEEMVAFIGDSHLYAADLRYTWAPTGNPRAQELILQGEVFLRKEDGSYEDADAGTGVVPYDETTSGWYAQGVYKFHPQWRVGGRYSQLLSANTPTGLLGSAMDSEGHDPYTFSAMGDWTNSEFSRLRLQYNYEKLARGQEDNQVLLQYIMSIGAHGAHKY